MHPLHLPASSLSALSHSQLLSTLTVACFFQHSPSGWNPSPLSLVNSQPPSAHSAAITLREAFPRLPSWANFLCEVLVKPHGRSFAVAFTLWQVCALLWSFDACHPHRTFSHMRPGTVFLSLFFSYHYIPIHAAPYFAKTYVFKNTG